MIEVRFTYTTKTRGTESNMIIQGKDLECTKASFKKAYPNVEFTNTEIL